MSMSLSVKFARKPRTQTDFARVVELVDTQDLKSCDHCDRAGSIPAPGTKVSLRAEFECDGNTQTPFSFFRTRELRTHTETQTKQTHFYFSNSRYHFHIPLKPFTQKKIRQFSLSSFFQYLLSF